VFPTAALNLESRGDIPPTDIAPIIGRAEGAVKIADVLGLS